MQAPSLSSMDAEELVKATQHALDNVNGFRAHNLRLRLVETDEKTSNEPGQDDTALTVRLLPRKDLALPTSHLLNYTEQLDISYPVDLARQKPASSSHLTTYVVDELRSLFNEEKATLEYILSQSNMFEPSAVGSQILETDRKDSIPRRVAKSFKYAETYHLSFSLFTPGVEPSLWDIEPALQEYLVPLLKAFSPISNFTIDTQVQLYAKFSPSATSPEYDESKEKWTLKKEDLSGFINAAEWPLSPSIGGGPTINFILYIPSPAQSPLVVKENGATSWLVPQWGGVSILNPPVTTVDGNPRNPSSLSQEFLNPAIATFSHQLISLLGMPSSPSSIPLRLQTLRRIHTTSLLLSASSTMGSLARLTRLYPSIPIPVTVANSVSRALSHLSTTCDLLQKGDFKLALENARIAEYEAERSFFEKSMVGQVYFPDEHKIAVYLPLLGPIGVPLVIGLLKESRRLLFKLKNRNV